MIRGIVALSAGGLIAVALTGCGGQGSGTSEPASPANVAPGWQRACVGYLRPANGGLNNCRSVNFAGYSITDSGPIKVRATFTVPHIPCTDGSSGTPIGTRLGGVELRLALVGRAAVGITRQCPHGKSIDYFAEMQVGNHLRYSGPDAKELVRIRPGDRVTVTINAEPTGTCSATLEDPDRAVKVSDSAKCDRKGTYIVAGADVTGAGGDFGGFAAPRPIPDFGTIAIANATINGKPLGRFESAPVDAVRYERYDLPAKVGGGAVRRAQENAVDQRDSIAIRTSRFAHNRRDFTLTYVPED